MRRLMIAAVAAAMLVGCNGSDSDEDPPPARTTGADAARGSFVRAVDGLCRRANPELARIQRELVATRDAGRSGRVGLSATFRAFERQLSRAAAITERFRRQLRAIDPPRGERGFYDTLTSSVERGGSNLRRQVTAARAQDAARLRELSVQGSVIAARQKGLITGHGGFRACGRG